MACKCVAAATASAEDSSGEGRLDGVGTGEVVEMAAGDPATAPPPPPLPRESKPGAAAAAGDAAPADAHADRRCARTPRTPPASGGVEYPPPPLMLLLGPHTSCGRASCELPTCSDCRCCGVASASRCAAATRAVATADAAASSSRPASRSSARTASACAWSAAAVPSRRRRRSRPADASWMWSSGRRDPVEFMAADTDPTKSATVAKRSVDSSCRLAPAGDC